jgi:hypothetical protein
MSISIRYELRTWITFFAILLASVFIHELGHCVPVWIKGYRAIPTPAKEYLLDNIPRYLAGYSALGGIMGSVIFSILFIAFFCFRYFTNGAVLAGAIFAPCMYSFLFLLKGRGHDATEFQDAQAALGFSYSGHAIDCTFLFLFLSGSLAWIIFSKPSYKTTGRLLMGFVLGFIFMVGLQKLNNRIFDPIFEEKSYVKE